MLLLCLGFLKKRLWMFIKFLPTEGYSRATGNLASWPENKHLPAAFLSEEGRQVCGVLGKEEEAHARLCPLTRRRWHCYPPSRGATRLTGLPARPKARQLVKAAAQLKPRHKGTPELCAMHINQETEKFCFSSFTSSCCPRASASAKKQSWNSGQ